MGIVEKIKEKIKSFFDSCDFFHIFWIIIFFDLAFLSFALGMRFERELYLEKHPLSLSREGEILVQEWLDSLEKIEKKMPFVASKYGMYYYPVSCSFSKKIKKENRIYFSTQKDAERQGFLPSKKCQE